jgi:hypothetical protein
MPGHLDHDAAEAQRRIWKAAHPELGPAIDAVEGSARGLGYIDGVPDAVDPEAARRRPVRVVRWRRLALITTLRFYDGHSVVVTRHGYGPVSSSAFGRGSSEGSGGCAPDC